MVTPETVTAGTELTKSRYSERSERQGQIYGAYFVGFHS